MTWKSVYYKYRHAKLLKILYLVIFEIDMGNGSSIESTKTVYLDINGKSEKVRNKYCVNQQVKWIHISMFIIICIVYFLFVILNVNNINVFLSMEMENVMQDRSLCILYFRGG